MRMGRWGECHHAQGSTETLGFGEHRVGGDDEGNPGRLGNVVKLLPDAGHVEEGELVLGKSVWF